MLDEKILSIADLPSIKDKFTLKGKKAFVTGAAGGIGRSSAATFAELGADVVIMDIPQKEELLKECAEQISKKYGVKVLPITGDVSSEESVKAMYKQIKAEFGILDVIHSNAGINVLDDGISMSMKSWQKMIDVNYTGMFLICKFGSKLMKNGGSMILTASMSGSAINKNASKEVTQLAYCSNKAAVIQLTKALAVINVDRGIRVNSISPGYILSGIHNHVPAVMVDTFLESTTSTVPMGRFGTLDEVCGVIALLATDLSSYMTGSDVICDGGYTIW